MNQVVSYELRDGIGVITVDYPPVNALGKDVRSGLADAVRTGLADAGAQALIVIGAGRTFPAGADIREFGQPPQGPALSDVIDEYEQGDKLIVAAIHGTALGGGLEVALGCDYRVAIASARVGLPEVKLGILPGAGGTQRLPRLIGVEPALQMIVSGDHIPAPKAKQLGVIDEIIDGDLLEGAITYARKLVADKAPARRLRDVAIKLDNPKLFEEFEASIARRQRGFLAPFHCIKAVKAATELPFDQGMERERELFMELLVSPQSKAQRHVFFAEREAARVPGLGRDVPTREINRVGIIGAGTMGGGIAMNFANVGIPVRLLEVKQEALDKGLAVIRRNYEGSAKRGRLTMEQVEERMQLIQPTLSYDDFKDVDLVIEAVFESMDLKKQIFAKLDEVCKPGAILASNTSTLSIDEIASATKRPQDVVGMHFFSPANVMRLLENVRGEKTADDVLATVMALARRINKVGVLVGNCDGFVGNRMLHQRGAEAVALVNEGATPAQVDKVLTDLGFPMGQFAMSDLAGIDIGYSIREERRKAGEDVPPSWMDDLAKQGRLGQKTGAGVYRYESGSRVPVPDADVDQLIAEFRKKQGITPREISDQEILERTMYVMINEGAKILEEGIASRSLDIDIVWIYGYGFPVYRGGPMFWADQIGLPSILEAIKGYHERIGGEQWKPAALLERLVSEGKGFGSL